MTIRAKFPGTCAACGAQIQPGQQIEWERGKQPRHVDCGAAQQTAAAPAPAAERQEKAPGIDAVVAGRAEYRGRTYYLAGREIREGSNWRDDRVEPVATRDGARLLLYFRDGSRQFWADRGQVRIVRRYERPQTIRGLQQYTADRRAGRARYECEECGEWVEPGTECWETGLLH
ncbi:MAG TPA: hypothetical protein VF158_04250 [Longimicrobiales bacterium]